MHLSKIRWLREKWLLSRKVDTEAVSTISPSHYPERYITHDTPNHPHLHVQTKKKKDTSAHTRKLSKLVVVSRQSI